MKFILSILLFVASVTVYAKVSDRVIDGKRSYHEGEMVGATYPLPCDSTEGATLNAGITPVALQLTPSINRKGTIYNSGTTFVFYRVSQWGLPPNWATVHGKIAPASFRDIDLSGAQQLWTWSAAVQTPAPSYMGCYSADARAYVPTVTPTITQTFTPTFTPTNTPTITPTATPTQTPA